jgi:hypothetical protein
MRALFIAIEKIDFLNERTDNKREAIQIFSRTYDGYNKMQIVSKFSGVKYLISFEANLKACLRRD